MKHQKTNGSRENCEGNEQQYSIIESPLGLEHIQPLSLHRLWIFIAEASLRNRGRKEISPEVGVLVVAGCPGLHHVLTLVEHKVLHRCWKP